LEHWWKKDVAPLHREWFQVLDDPTKKKVVIDCFRGAAKSTHSRAYMLNRICEGMAEEYTLVSRTGAPDPKSPAVKSITIIKREIEENVKLRHTYGLKKGAHWTESNIEIIRMKDNRRINFYCVGKRGSIRGSRGDVIFDDLQNIDDWKSETIITRDEDWYFGDVRPVILPEQRLIYLGTIGSPISLLATIEKIKGYLVLKFPIDHPIGSFRSVWPDQYPDDYIRELLEEYMTGKRQGGLAQFEAEYRCKARVSENPIFEEDQMQYYDRDSAEFKEVEDILYKVTAGDGAFSQKKSADWSAIVTFGATSGPNPKIYCLDVQRGKWRVNDAAEKVMQVYDQQHQNITFIESICTPPDVDSFVLEVQNAERFHNKYVSLRWGKPRTDKVNRAYQVQRWFQGKRVYFDRNSDAQRELVNELIMFTGDETFPDDQVDASVWSLIQIGQRAREYEQKAEGKKVRRPGERNPVTGYV
jgi:predicted phage terminase large subunit-like protein